MTHTLTLPARSNPASSNWRLTGARPGPVLLVTGTGPALQGALKRLQSLPSLVYLRGELRVQSKPCDAPTDHHIPLKAASETDAYWTILATAATLGMITGRGIPAHYLPQTEPTKVAA